MLQLWSRFCVLIILVLMSLSQTWAAGPPVHNFHCKECHLSGLTINELGGDNVCLKCHNPVAGDVTPNDGAPPELDGHTEGRFTSGDASNAFGHGTGLPTADQTSHTWYAPSDTLAAAGASAPLYSEHPEFYSNYGTSTGRLTCTRCHEPHAFVDTNPKLLIKGVNSADAMCRACHALWDQSDNHGWLTHPVVESYNAALATHPDKYRTTPINKETADIQLVDGGVSCTSCHGVHFVDSDATTPDGVPNINNLNKSMGKLLRGDGPYRADKASLCQTCHKYKRHGDDNGEKPGNKGSLYNFVKAFELSNSKYFMWASGHDIWSENLIEKIINQLELNPGASIGYGTTVWIDENNSEAQRQSGWIDTRGMHPVERFFSTIWGNVHPILGVMRSKDLKTTRFINTAGTDLIILADMALKGDFLHIAESTCYRRELNIRTNESQQDRIKRYQHKDFKLSSGIFNKLLPLLRLPIELTIIIIKSKLSIIEKIYLLFAAFPTFLIKYLVARKK